jgi:hypothetical protein
MRILKRRTIVILSEVRSVLRALLAESKDPSHAACHPETGALRPSKDLGEPREAARSLPRNNRAFGSLPYCSNRDITFLLGLTLLLSPFASAQTLTGTVKNATTGRPAAGDEVVLLSLGQGMEESGRTQTDGRGNFSFKLNKAQTPHLVRVLHQEVTYHRMAPPGTTSVEVEVYDAGKKVAGIEVVADIMRVQAEQGQLQVMRAFAVENNSKPPRTQMNERNLEFYVPEGAQIMESQALTANGEPVNSAPVPVDDKKTRYAYLFPLRPGTTQFQLAYQLPYTGSANLDPRSLYPLQHFVAILPKTMQFSAAPGTNFQPMNDPQQPDANVQVASGTTLGQSLAFKISGEGTLQARNENADQPSAGGSAEGGSAQADNRPGGGLGPPIDAPDPLHRYQLPILIGVTLALAAGGVYTAFRQQAAARSVSRPKAAKAGKAAEQDAGVGYEEIAAPAVRPVAQPTKTPDSASSMLLAGLKEEIFQLEVEHKQGRISQQEYEKTKAALDHTLQRALKREAQRG